jgi:hypothetical protein
MQTFRCALLALFVLPFVGCSDGNDPAGDVTSGVEWQTYQDPLGRYTIELPVPPPSPPRGNFLISLSPRATFAVNVALTTPLAEALPAEWQAFLANPSSHEAANALLAEHLRQIIHRLKNPSNPNRPGENHTVASATAIEREGVPGVDVVMQLDNGHSYTRRLFLTPEHVYEVIANIGAGELDPSVTQRVLDSFYVKPRMTAAAAPPNRTQ